MADNQFRRSPSGPVITYPATDSGKVIAVRADGTLAPAAAGSLIDSTVPNVAALATRSDEVGRVVRQLDADLNWVSVATDSQDPARTYRAGLGVGYELITDPSEPPSVLWGPLNWGAGDSDILFWGEAEDLAVGSQQYWNDHRYYPGSPYGTCVQATPGSRPACSTSWNDEKWLDFSSDWMQMPAAIATALTSATGFGNLFFLFYCRTYQPAANYIYQNQGGSAGIFAGGQHGYCYVDNTLSGGNTAQITRRGVLVNAMAPDPRYFGAMNSHVEGILFDNQRLGVYLDGSVAYAAAPAAFTSGTNCLGQASGFNGSMRTFIIGRGVPSSADLLRFDQWMRRRAVRKVLWDGNSILGNIVSGPPSGSFPWFTEEQLGARYSVENRGIPSQQTKELLTRWELETAPRLRPGDVVVLHEILNSIGAGDDTATVLANVAAYCGLANRVGVIPLVTTCMPSTALNPAQEAERVAINAALTASPRTYGAAAVVPFAAVPEAQDPANLTYFVDGTHPTSALHQILAVPMAATVKAIAPV